MKKRILLMIPTPPPYMGPSVASLVILNSKLKDYFELILLDTADRRSLRKLGNFDLFNLYHFLKQFFLLFIKNLFLKIDLNYLLLTQTRIGIFRDFVFFSLLKLLRKKVIFHFRGSGIFKLYDDSGFLIKFFIRKIFLNSSGIIFLCEKLKVKAEEKFSGGKYFSLSNGINILKVEREKRDFKNILFLSNLKREKGFFDVVKIIPEVLSENGEIKFLFGGEFLFKGDRDVEKILEKYKENIELYDTPHGEVKEELFLRGDIFLLPSYNEGMPWAIIEALGYSLPVISTDVGCIYSMVLDGKNGFLIEPGDKNALFEKISLFIKGKADHIECGKMSRKIYEERFTEKIFIDGLKKIFEEVLK